MRADPALTPWSIHQNAVHRGGRVIVPREHAPLGRRLPYQRAAGEAPPHTGRVELAWQRGWVVDLGDRALGDMLLALALVRALVDATGLRELAYAGPRPELLSRWAMPVQTRYAAGPHLVRTGNPTPLPFHAAPEDPPTWLDSLDNEAVEVHAALPMRYYLGVEEALGVRLPASHAPTPPFTANQRAATPFHVVFVSATSRPDRKDYGSTRFAGVADALARRREAPWRFTLITSLDGSTPDASTCLPMEVLHGPPAVTCLDVFAAAEVVIGNDTGLTHLAALTQRLDGTGPQVIALHGRHSHTKWTTGSDRHHAIATAFAQMLAAADRCPVRDFLDDTLWSTSADLSAIPPALVAELAGSAAGWW